MACYLERGRVMIIIWGLGIIYVSCRSRWQRKYPEDRSLLQQLESWAMGAMSLPREGEMTQGVVLGTCCHHVVLRQEGRILCWAVSEEGAAGESMYWAWDVQIGMINWCSCLWIPHPEGPSCSIWCLQLFHPVLSRTTPHQHLLCPHRNHHWAALLPWQGLLVAKPVWVQPRATNSKKWPLMKSQMSTFPNRNRSVSGLNFAAHGSSCKNRALASPELL